MSVLIRRAGGTWEDLSTYGLVTADVSDLRDGLYTEYPLERISGRLGRAHVSRNGAARERIITVSGADRADHGPTQHATFLANLRALKFRTLRQTIDLAFADEPTWYWRAVLEAAPIPSIAPVLSQRMANVRWTFLIADPRQFEDSLQNLNINAGPVQTPMDLAPVYPLLTFTGPIAGDFAVIYRNPVGTELSRLGIIGGLGAGDVLTVDCESGLMTLNGTTDASTMLDGDTDFIMLDPLDGSDGPYTTLAVSPSGTLASATAQYRRARI